MNPGRQEQSFARRLLWPGICIALLAVWTTYCHLSWSHQAGHLPGLLAFFVGLLVLILVNALVRLSVRTWQRGLRWLVSSEAWRLCGWTVVFAVSTVVLFYNVELWRGKRAWAAVVREAEARGVPLDYEASIPPQPPEDQNFAKAPLFAPLFETRQIARSSRPGEYTSPELGEFERFAVRLYRAGTPFAPWLEGHISSFQTLWNFHFLTNRTVGRPSSTSTSGFANNAAAAAAMLVELETQGSMLDELRKFSDRPECWFPPDELLAGLLFSRQADAMNGLLRVLRLRASAEVALNQSTAAFGDVQFILRLADLGRQKPQPTSVAYAFHHLAVVDALQPLWEGLAKRCWTAEQIAEVQRQLEGLNLLGDYPDAVRADGVTMATMVERLIPTSGSGRPMPVMENPEDERPLRWIRLFYPGGWSLQDQAAILRFHLETTSEYLDLTARRIAGQRHGEPRGLLSSSDPFYPVFMVPKLLQMYDDASESFPFAQTAVDLATLACALERYRLAQGELPATLAELAPQFLAKLPNDVFTGEPLKYRRMDDGGFLIYSVGFNKTDDGGKPCVRHTNWRGETESRFDLDQNDWVWSRPAAHTGN